MTTKTYSLVAFAEQYALTVEQLFDRGWMLYDITKLKIRHRDNPITFIHDGNRIPKFFEYRTTGVNGQQVRGEFLNHIDELTVNQWDINEWFAAATSTQDRRATNTYRQVDLCTHSHSWVSTMLGTILPPKSLLLWHQANRRQMIEDAKNPPVRTPPTPSIFQIIKRKLFA